MSDKAKKLSLIIGLSLPVFMVILIAVSIYLPSFFIKPKTDFIFSNGGDYYKQRMYSVKGGKIIENEIIYPENYQQPKSDEEPQLYYYDVENDRAVELSFEEAQQYKLDSQAVSKDGFTILSGDSYSVGFLGLFGGRSYYYDRYLTKGAYSKQLNVGNSDQRYNYYYSFRFLGWVKE